MEEEENEKEPKTLRFINSQELLEMTEEELAAVRKHNDEVFRSRGDNITP